MFNLNLSQYVFMALECCFLLEWLLSGIRVREDQ